MQKKIYQLYKIRYEDIKNYISCKNSVLIYKNLGIKIQKPIYYRILGNSHVGLIFAVFATARLHEIAKNRHSEN